MARYATSALRAAQRTFTLVTAEPTNLYLQGEDFGDELPSGRIALPRLRDLLLAPSTSLPTRDAVWRELIVTEWALCARLVRAAHKAGVRLVYAEAAFDGARWEEFDSRAPIPPWGHPDFLLLGAVDAGVITEAEAKLIATTRLEDVPVDQVAAFLRERTNTVVQRRRRAENRLAAALAEGEVTALETTPSLALPARPPRQTMPVSAGVV